jgi:pilus assembly protein CpaF
MAYLIHQDGTRTDLSFLGNNEFLTIGSARSCDVCLQAKGVHRIHCRLSNIRGWYYVMPLSSKKPVLINDLQVTGKEQRVRNGDKLSVGEWNILFQEEMVAQPIETTAMLASAPAAVPVAEKEKLKLKIHEVLLERMDLKTLDAIGAASTTEIRQRAQQQIAEIIKELSSEVIRVGTTPEAMQKEVVHDVLGYGPLEELLDDPAVSEIMCFGKNRMYVERNGKLSAAPAKFDSPEQLVAIIERIVGPLGRRIDESSPIVDARLPDGSRVNAVIPPIAIDGPSLDIRKFSAKTLKIDDLIAFGSLSPAMGQFLEVAVERRMNIVISGGTGSGKTTLLNVVSSFIPEDERIVTIEDSAELRLEQSHVVRLETRPPNIEGKGELTIRDLVRNALRMRPDRIIVGEVRGGEALDMLQAMNTGHDGSLTTIHANSPRDVLGRLETLVLMSGMDLPIRAIRQQVGAAVNIICQQSRLNDGSRKIVNITELNPPNEDGEITMQDIFVFRQTGYDEKGKVLGEFIPTGTIPNFILKLRERGIDVDMSMFVTK